jgi:hypothetical protein
MTIDDKDCIDRKEEEHCIEEYALIQSETDGMRIPGQ